MVRNCRREGPGLLTFIFPAAPLRLELAGLALEPLERLQGLLAVAGPAHPAVDAGEDVVIGRRARVGRDGALQRRDRVVQFAETLGGTPFLEPGAIRSRIEGERLVGVLQPLCRIVRT